MHEVRWTARPGSLDEYIRAHRAFLYVANLELYRTLDGPGLKRVRLGTSELAFRIRRALKISDDVLEWRLVSILQNAYKLGAFNHTNYEMRQGVGWRLRVKSLRRKEAA